MFTSLSNDRGLEQPKYKQCNSKDGQKMWQHSLMELIQKNFSAKILGGGGQTDGTSHTKV